MSDPQELPEDGYQDIRDHVIETWRFVQVDDNAGNHLMRVPATDPRVRWVTHYGDPVIELNITLSGSDPELFDPDDAMKITTIAATTLHKTDTEETIRSRVDYTDAIIDSPDKIVLLRHIVQIPEVI